MHYRPAVNVKVDPTVVGVKLTLEQVFTGMKLNVSITRPRWCPHCGGTGAKTPEKLVDCDKCSGTGHHLYLSHHGDHDHSHDNSNASHEHEDEFGPCGERGYKCAWMQVKLSTPFLIHICILGSLNSMHCSINQSSLTAFFATSFPTQILAILLPSPCLSRLQFQSYFFAHFLSHTRMRTQFVLGNL